MDCDSSFSSNFMLLKPEEVSVVDLVRILHSDDLEKRKFVDVPKGETQSFKRRWTIVVSVLVQKLLLSTSKPMARFGSSVERWMNLVSCNRNMGRLLLNYMRGRVERLDEASPEYVSFTGYFDKRKELGISNEDSRYYGALSIMAAKASYENKAYIKTIVNDIWKMKFLDFYDFYNAYQDKSTTQAYLFQDKETDPDLVVVAFRGTEPFDADAWCSDFDISWYELPDIGKVHGGFMKALGLQKNQGWPEKIKAREDQQVAYYAIRDMLREIMLANKRTKFIVTGHSLGGALAILFPAVLAFHNEADLLDRIEGIYTFGQPRVGDEEFAKFMKNKFEKHNVRYYRSVYCNDIVPRLPYDDKTLMFKHFGTCIYYDSFYKGRIVEEEPNKNYFSPLAAIPKMINAIWELIRSFVIPYTKGPEYKEGTFLRVFRVLGLMVAGVPAHSTHEYVNAIRLGDPNLFISTTETPKIQVEIKENSG